MMRAWDCVLTALPDLPDPSIPEASPRDSSVTPTHKIPFSCLCCSKMHFYPLQPKDQHNLGLMNKWVCWVFGKTQREKYNGYVRGWLTTHTIKKRHVQINTMSPERTQPNNRRKEQNTQELADKPENKMWMMPRHASKHVMWQPGQEGGLGGEWMHVYVWLSPFAVHLKLSQRC